MPDLTFNYNTFNRMNSLQSNHDAEHTSHTGGSGVHLVSSNSSVGSSRASGVGGSGARTRFGRSRSLGGDGGSSSCLVTIGIGSSERGDKVGGLAGGIGACGFSSRLDGTGAALSSSGNGGSVAGQTRDSSSTASLDGMADGSSFRGGFRANGLATINDVGSDTLGLRNNGVNIDAVGGGHGSGGQEEGGGNSSELHFGWWRVEGSL